VDPNVPSLGGELTLHPLINQSHSWLRSAFMLKTQGNCVTLWCFRAPNEFEGRLKTIQASKGWKDAFNDPYALFVIVLDELMSEVAQSVKNLSVVFGGLEFVPQHPPSYIKIEKANSLPESTLYSCNEAR
jgi:hypothetical protein